MKIAGLVMISVSAFAAAAYNITGTKKKIAAHEALLSLVLYIKEQIVTLHTPLPEIYSSYENKLLREYSFCSYLCSCTWREALNQSGLAALLDARCVKLLNEFGDKLGKTPAQEQGVMCDYCAARFREIVDKLNQELPRKSKMTSSLCVIGGIAVIILLI